MLYMKIDRCLNIISLPLSLFPLPSLSLSLSPSFSPTLPPFSCSLSLLCVLSLLSFSPSFLSPLSLSLSLSLSHPLYLLSIQEQMFDLFAHVFCGSRGMYTLVDTMLAIHNAHLRVLPCVVPVRFYTNFSVLEKQKFIFKKSVTTPKYLYLPEIFLSKLYSVKLNINSIAIRCKFISNPLFLVEKTNLVSENLPQTDLVSHKCLI